MNLLDLLTSAWAIQPAKLLEIQAIYAAHFRGEKIDIAAIEARLGRPLSSEQQEYTVEPGGIAVLQMSGIIAPKANLFMQVSGGLSTQMATKQLESATADPRVRATVLAMDTPGGNVIGTPEMAAAVHELSKVKPIITHSDGTLASAGYWIGAAANAIYISGPVTEVGSIGVVVNRTYNPNTSAEEETIVAGKYKRLAEAKKPLSAESRAIVQADVDYVYSLFVDDVAAYRGATSEQVLEHMADGRVFRGQQAIDAGLVDGVSTLDALVEQLATDPSKFAARRKAVFALGGLPSKGAGAAPKDKPSTREKGAQSMADEKTPITRASFEQDHAPLFAQIRTEFMALGATQERDRIQGVRATAIPGHEALVEKLAFDGQTQPGQAALAVLEADKATRTAAAQAFMNDAPKAVKPSAATDDAPLTAKQVAAGMVALHKQIKGA